MQHTSAQHTSAQPAAGYLPTNCWARGGGGRMVVVEVEVAVDVDVVVERQGAGIAIVVGLWVQAAPLPQLIFFAPFRFLGSPPWTAAQPNYTHAPAPDHHHNYPSAPTCSLLLALAVQLALRLQPCRCCFRFLFSAPPCPPPKNHQQHNLSSPSGVHHIPPKLSPFTNRHFYPGNRQTQLPVIAYRSRGF